MKSIRNILRQVKETISETTRSATAWYDANYYGGVADIPDQKDEEKVVNYVMSIWRESYDWRKVSFGGRMRYWDPYDWFRLARRLEEGMHWDVWGRRNEGDGDKWKQELQDPEIEDQIRLKKSHLTSNWHDIDVMPNIRGIQDVLNQERQRTKWGDSVIQGVQRGLTEGMATWFSFLDRTRYPDGVAKELLLDNESLFPTPFATSLEKLGGCWYLGITTLVPEQQIFQMYPKLHRTEERIRFDTMSADIAKSARLSLDLEQTATKSFTHTKMTPMITVLMDDPKIDKPSVDQEEIALEHHATSEGVPIKVYPDQNHKAHIEAHLKFITEMGKEIEAATKIRQQGPAQMQPEGQGAPTGDAGQGQPPQPQEEQGQEQPQPEEEQSPQPQPQGEQPQPGQSGIEFPGTKPEDIQRMTAMAELMVYHIKEHAEKIKSDAAVGINPNENPRYPAGRKIVIAGGIVLEDEPIKDVEDWRDLVHIWYYEKIPYSFWGRGVPEVLFNTNKGLDTMLSRDADMAISAGMQKAYFNEEDKENLDEAAYDNDPLKPIFTKQPPVFRGALVPNTNMAIYGHLKANAAKQLGVNETSFGQSPGANTSAEMVKTLQAQNQVMLTGEPNQRLSDTLEGVIKTRIRFWKEHYTEPRIFFQNGIPKAINVSEMVSKFQIQGPDGKPQMKDVPEFMVSVRANSNFPQRFEYKLQFLMNLARTPSPDGSPYVPREALLDVLAEFDPRLGREGEYYQMAEALKMGLEKMADMQKKQAADIKTKKTLMGAVRKRGIRELMGEGVTSQQPEGGTEPDSSLPENPHINSSHQ